MPWLSIVRGSPIGLSGVSLALGNYNIQPTEYYALLTAVLAIAGAVLPNTLPKRKTWSRAVLAFLGILVLILMRYHLPGTKFAVPEMFSNPTNDIEWRLGFYFTLTTFSVVAVLNLAAIMGFFKPRRQRQKSPK